MLICYYTNHQLEEELACLEKTSQEVMKSYFRLKKNNIKFPNDILDEDDVIWRIRSYLRKSHNFNDLLLKKLECIKIEVVFVHGRLGIARNNCALNGIIFNYNSRYIIILSCNNKDVEMLFIHELCHVFYDLLYPYEKGIEKIEGDVEIWTEKILQETW